MPQSCVKKSRNGCMRCKSKRIKCDETKPACVQCTKKMLRCPGFSQPLKWSTKYEVFQSSPQQLVPPDGPSEDGKNPLLVDTALDCEGLPLSVEEDQAVMAQLPHALVHSPDAIRYSPRVAGVVPSVGRHSQLPVILRWVRSVSSISPQLVHVPSLLVDYYFDRICVIFSSFDSIQNPFRTVIARLWPRSPVVYHSIQSMAAACLADQIPHMRVIGLQAQYDAINFLRHGLSDSSSPSPISEDAIFAIILLGLSTSWHDTQDLGLAYLHAARVVINSNLLVSKSIGDQNHLQAGFLGGALVYWEMLAALVSNDFELSDYDHELDSTSGRGYGPASSRIVPHPFTGAVPQTMMLFRRTAGLIRRERVRAYTKPSATAADLEERATEFATAETLEEELLSLELPSVTDIVDPGDEKTPLDHLLTISEVYRCACLLMIYRVFPEVLSKRLGLRVATEELEGHSPLYSPLSWGTGISFVGSIESPPSVDVWLTSLSSYMLGELRRIPPTSGTRCIQPVLFVIASSELRFSTPPLTPAELDATMDPLGLSMNLFAEDVDVGRCRGFVLDRLSMFMRSLPSKPVVRMNDLVREIWSRLDKGESVFWMDVMIEKGWETIMG
ncbi:MAG: hypothetical protein M1813_009815 [Trichoglossum hirsutum]|nr:MAG: hypothetical protein M1813_009815 [Trichoglossum hirsutum]